MDERNETYTGQFSEKPNKPETELTPLGAILAFFLIIFLVMCLVKIGLIWFT